MITFVLVGPRLKLPPAVLICPRQTNLRPSDSYYLAVYAVTTRGTCPAQHITISLLLLMWLEIGSISQLSPRDVSFVQDLS